MEIYRKRSCEYMACNHTNDNYIPNSVKQLDPCNCQMMEKNVAGKSRDKISFKFQDVYFDYIIPWHSLAPHNRYEEA